jgi:hypothetical protein
MFHYSGRLAGLDGDMVLKISAPSKVTSAISKCALDSEPYLKVKKVPKRKARRACRPPLTDKTFVNNVVCNKNYARGLAFESYYVNNPGAR